MTHSTATDNLRPVLTDLTVQLPDQMIIIPVMITMANIPISMIIIKITVDMIIVSVLRGA